MPRFRRSVVPGGTFFFTVVTDRRRPLFADPRARRILGSVFRRCLLREPFTVNAIVWLEDHLHAIWTLPPGDTAYSQRWGWIKREFSRHWLAGGGHKCQASQAKKRQRQRGVWQPRFWEHTIEHEEDFTRHFDYVHFNPVKHGLPKRARDWPWSSFHRWVRTGVYPSEWGGGSISATTAAMQHSAGDP